MHNQSFQNLKVVSSHGVIITVVSPEFKSKAVYFLEPQISGKLVQICTNTNSKTSNHFLRENQGRVALLALPAVPVVGPGYMSSSGGRRSS